MPRVPTKGCGNQRREEAMANGDTTQRPARAAPRNRPNPQCKVSTQWGGGTKKWGKCPPSRRFSHSPPVQAVAVTRSLMACTAMPARPRACGARCAPLLPGGARAARARFFYHFDRCRAPVVVVQAVRSLPYRRSRRTRKLRGGADDRAAMWGICPVLPGQHFSK